MTREPTVTYYDFKNALGEQVCAFTVYCKNNAEREARAARAKSGPIAEAYTPFGHAGEAYDPPEHTPQPVSGKYAPTAVYRVSYQEQGRVGLELVPESEWRGPPNCDGSAQYGQVPTQAGQVLAQAQHEAAASGDDCTATACLITRGSD